MSSQQITQEQEIVRLYLEQSGCKVGGFDPNGCMMFTPKGASGNGGSVFPNGNVYIFNEHTEPFSSKTTSFYGVLTMLYGKSGASKYMQRKKPEEIERKAAPKAHYVATLEEDEKEIPTLVGMLENASVPRRSDESLLRAISNGEIRCVEFKDAVSMIRNSISPAWKRCVEKLKDGSISDAEEYRAHKAYIKENLTPCFTQILGTNPTIGWLDVDGKENDAICVSSVRKRLINDKRVVAVFRSLSGDGLAIGIGIYADSKDAYEAAMKKAVRDFERDYDGLKIDRTCTRYTQLRALSGDSDVIVRETAQYYRGYTMIPQELQQTMNETSEKIDNMVSRTKKEAFACAPTMLEELDRAIEKLEIEIAEDKWTGKRSYKLKGQDKKDINSLYLAIKDFEQKENANVYKFGKVDIIDHLIANCTDERDVVMNTVFSKAWDKKDRWSDLKSALHLDDFSLKAFQMWMRQGAGLLYNTGEADDVQRNFMLILYSRRQSIGKSDLARRLSCGTNSFTQKGLDMGNKDVLTDLYSHWIHEFGELGTTFRKKDLNYLKNYITNTSITIRRPYDRDSSVFPVRTSIIGTTNDDKLFTDDTGNRRYIVIDCQWDRSDWEAIDALDFNSLWLQARWEYMHERNSQDGLYPYIMDASFQKENDERCREKIVKPKEMYVLSSIFSEYHTDRFGIVQDAGSKVCISMARLMRKIDADKIYNVSEVMLGKSLRHYGFECVSSATDDVYYMDKDVFLSFVRTDLSFGDDPDFTFDANKSSLTII